MGLFNNMIAKINPDLPSSLLKSKSIPVVFIHSEKQEFTNYGDTNYNQDNSPSNMILEVVL